MVFRGRPVGAVLGLLSVVGCTPSSSSEPVAPAALSAAHEVSEAEPSGSDGPRLVLWLTIDQMRGDYLEKYAAHFGADGFARLLNSGRHFTDAHYGHAITETAPGHATLFTGVSPKEHGIVGNSWIVPSGEEVASVTDENMHIIGPGGSRTDEGRSPFRLLVSTIGDELMVQTGARAKVVGVSTKDRGAILPAGKSGKAFWIGASGFVSSTYYSAEAPSWLRAHHKGHEPRTYLKGGWPLLLEEAKYQNAPSISQWKPKSWNADFPHKMTVGAKATKALTVSPFGDAAVVDAALAAVEGEGLGKDGIVDLLSVSLSSTDLIGHLYGPESREMEDQLVRLDRQLAKLFSGIERVVPWDELIVVLSADHGGCESAEHMKSVGKEGRRLLESDIETAARDALRKKFSNDKFLLGVASPYVFLNRELIEKKGASLEQARQAVVEAVAAMAMVHSAHSLGSPGGEGQIKDRLVEALHPDRSGDVYVIPEKHTLFLQSDSLAATHGSPWHYDTHVPIIVVAPGVEPGEAPETVDVRSLTPTVAKLMGIEAPRTAKHPVLSLAD